MPTYNYKCPNCSQIIEKHHPISDSIRLWCHCGNKMEMAFFKFPSVSIGFTPFLDISGDKMKWINTKSEAKELEKKTGNVLMSQKEGMQEAFKNRVRGLNELKTNMLDRIEKRANQVWGD